ncbi:unnamed protein product [Ixodes pacificus]
MKITISARDVVHPDFFVSCRYSGKLTQWLWTLPGVRFFFRESGSHLRFYVRAESIHSAVLGARIVATFKRCTYPFVFGVAFPFPPFRGSWNPTTSIVFSTDLYCIGWIANGSLSCWGRAAPLAAFA